MLAISPAASAAISSVLEDAEVPDTAGVRLAAEQQTEQGTAISITFVAAAAPGDQVIDTGAPAGVFVDPTAAALLDDQVLEADVEPDGGITFSLHAQPGSADGAGPSAP